jgi:hypothetical protein
MIGNTYSQDGFRFRNDDGSETEATWISALNTVPASLPVDENFRVRFLLSSVASASASILTAKVYASHNGGSFVLQYADGSTVLKATGSAFSGVGFGFWHGSNTTQQIGSGQYDAAPNAGISEGQAWMVTNQLDWAKDAGAETEIEVEYCMQINSALVSPGDTIELRVFNTSGDPFTGAYNEVPIIIVPSSTLALKYGTLELKGGTLDIK